MILWLYGLIYELRIMRVIRTGKQKDNLAKYLYDVSKIIFAVVVIGPFVKPESINIYVFLFGLSATIIFYIFASRIDMIKFKNNE
ncbi:MAG: hypothetical protein FVQ77_14410 [Cytophagales bacterium]|nr:hypothetical protein [Cytophagales bacterium]